MDSSGFDRLAQFLRGTSRRNALRVAIGSAGLATGGLIASTIDSDANKKHRRCKKRKQTCPTCLACPTCPACQAKAIGQACTSAADCCGTETGNSCGVPNGGQFNFVCCSNRGKACTVASECCAPLVCGNGFCAVPV
jgi:hypothetical protein